MTIGKAYAVALAAIVASGGIILGTGVAGAAPTPPNVVCTGYVCYNSGDLPGFGTATTWCPGGTTVTGSAYVPGHGWGTAAMPPCPWNPMNGLPGRY
ncbi:hypothetical protein [Jongsikchunia kroppenstedtii]|uniref:hypothetical protein n=1 Tax=Jongsikchunia kroppenstedtii TaxID=1121721 RepID=UPI0005BCC577|nr:hypothetical protein [Jongsikchunia kroppenstedtii]